MKGCGDRPKKDGKVYGATVDCNPNIIWYNKKLLMDAGIAEMPADLYEKGQWNWNTFKGMIEKTARERQARIGA